MSLWVKICANTSLADAQLAAEAGADAVGFVFAPSPRQVTRELVAEITPQLPDAIEKIGVFVDADFTEIVETVGRCGLSGAQLHASNQPGLATALRQRFGSGLRILQVIHFGADAPQQMLALETDASLRSSVDGILVDSRTATEVGGTGMTFDWLAARRTLFTEDRALKLIAAGGLRPSNVGQAIAALGPWGVDVATGVEASPGRKDPAKVRAFVANARAAFADVPDPGPRGSADELHLPG